MDTTILGILIGSVTVAFGVLLGHFLARCRDRTSRFNTAAETFRSAFWPEVQFLDRKYLVDRAGVYATKRSCDILYEAASRHQEATFKFLPYLWIINRYRLNRAWKQYCKEGNNIHYFSEEYPCDDRLKQSFSEEKALKRINKILKFAKPK